MEIRPFVQAAAPVGALQTGASPFNLNNETGSINPLAQSFAQNQEERSSNPLTQRQNTPTQGRDPAQEIDKQRMAYLIEQQQQEMEKLQQQMLRQSQPSGGDTIQQMIQMRPFESAINQKATQIAGLESRLGQLIGQDSIGGFVAQPLGSSQRISYVA